jgi:hypothetical protein
MHRFIINILFVSLFGISSFAQVTTVLTLQARPTSKLSEWATRNEVMQYSCLLQGSVTSMQVKIKAEFRDASGTVLGNANLANLPITTILNGVNILFAKDVLLLQYFTFTPSVQKALNQNGRLPEGNYQLCLQLVTTTDYKPVSAEVCKSFFVTSYLMPVLILPANNSKLPVEKAKTAIIFRWTPLSPQPTTLVNYRLQVFEILDEQTAMQAFRANQPLLNTDVIGTTQYIWTPQMDMLHCCGGADSLRGKKFIWTIQTLDTEGTGFNNGVGDGRSEPYIFTIQPFRVEKNE